MAAGEQTTWRTIEDIDPSFVPPATVDFNVNGLCNLNCPWCWGPAHTREIETVTTADWLNMLRGLGAIGVESVVFTGGEPLLKKDLPALLQGAKAAGLRTTLSTNGLLLPKLHAGVLPHVDDLGIPIDGPTEETNAVMRVPLSMSGGPRHLSRALESLRIAQGYPGIELTLRTVVSAKNRELIGAIGGVVVAAGVDPTALRWKLYQCTPEGPRQDEVLNGGWLVSDEEFNGIVARLREENSDFTITAQAIQDRSSRYFFVYPDGETGIMGDQVGVAPTGSPVYGHISAGNIIGNLPGVMRKLWEINYQASK